MITPSRDVIEYSMVTRDPVELIRRDSGYEMEILPLQMASRHMKKSRPSKRKQNIRKFHDEDDWSDEDTSSQKDKYKSNGTYAKNSVHKIIKSNNINNNNNRNNNNINNKNNNNMNNNSRNKKPNNINTNLKDFKRTKIGPSPTVKKSGLGALIDANKQFMLPVNDTLNIDSDYYRGRTSLRGGDNNNPQVYGRHKVIPKHNNNDYIDSSDEEMLSNDNDGYNGRSTIRQLSSNHSNNNNNSSPIETRFEEYIDDDPLFIRIHNNMKISEYIELAISKYPRAVRGTSYIHYDVYEYDDEIEKDSPAINKEQIVLKIGVTSFALCLNDKGKSLPDPPKTKKSRRSVGLYDISNDLNHQLESKQDSNSWENDRRGTIRKLKSFKTSFVRVIVPGPSNEQHTIKLDDESTTSTLRDLYFMLNRKKQGVHFNPNFFEAFEQGKTREDPLDVTTPLLELSHKQIVILPKNIGNLDPERETAFNFPLVRLANEYKEWRANKVRNNNKSGRLLGVDRKRITKQATSTINDIPKRKGTFLKGINSALSQLTKQNHIPVNISSVTKIRILSDDPKCCTLEYNHHKGGKRSHIYQFKSKQDCRDLVDKISYLMELNRLRPI